MNKIFVILSLFVSLKSSAADMFTFSCYNQSFRVSGTLLQTDRSLFDRGVELQVLGEGPAVKVTGFYGAVLQNSRRLRFNVPGKAHNVVLEIFDRADNSYRSASAQIRGEWYGMGSGKYYDLNCSATTH